MSNFPARRRSPSVAPKPRLPSPSSPVPPVILDVPDGRPRHRSRRSLLRRICLVLALCLLLPPAIAVACAAGDLRSQGYLTPGQIGRALLHTGRPPAACEESSSEVALAAEESSVMPDVVASPAEDPVETSGTAAVPASASDEENTIRDNDFSIVIDKRDMSFRQRGPAYLQNDTSLDPSAVVPFQAPDGRPVVLIVSSHPYEGYADGGTVSQLTARLADELRSRGISTVLIPPSVSGLTPESSLRSAFTRTQTLARYYCRLYPDICLVVDLRRSAELVGDASLLATDGQIAGVPCAQLRLIVDAMRQDAARQDAMRQDAVRQSSPQTGPADLSLAMALRRALWDIDPSLSRPVWWRAGTGLLPVDAEGRSPALLTVEVGAAGDEYARAARTLPALAQCLAALLLPPEV